MKYNLLCLGSLFMVFWVSLPAQAEIGGKAEARIDYYPDDPLFPDQSSDRLQTSFALELASRESLGNDFVAAYSLFGKIDPHASRRFSGDVREAWLGYNGENSEWRLGMLTERWGVLEAENIVDILNPRDAVEDFQGDVKLGIAGVTGSYLGENSQLGFWLLPYSRPRRLAQEEDRFRNFLLPLGQPEFDNGRSHPTLAVRASTVQSDLEIAVSHFYGHSRTPRFTLETDLLGRPKRLNPTYDLINQTNLELLWVRGHSLWKLEAFYQNGPEDDFFGVGAGVEREMPRIWNSKASLTFYIEGYYDGRDASAMVPIAPFQQDIFIGARLAMNDVKSTEFQIRFTQDLEYDATLLDLRASRRLNSNWSMEAKLYSFLNTRDDPALGGFQDDHRIQFKLIRNF